ncbi:hypothetical protein LXL04_016516 [Taraxacum kok-saghyz]
MIVIGGYTAQIQSCNFVHFHYSTTHPSGLLEPWISLTSNDTTSSHRFHDFIEALPRSNGFDMVLVVFHCFLSLQISSIPKRSYETPWVSRVNRI